MAQHDLKTPSERSRTHRTYLDTSAIRALGSRLADSPRTDLVTSVVTVVELVNAAASATSDRRFSSARTGLRILYGDRIVVDRRLPEELMFGAFNWFKGKMKFKEERLDSLDGVVSSLMAFSTRAEFEKRESAGARSHPVEYWTNYDAQFGAAYISATAAGNREIRAALEKAQRGEGKLGYLPPEVREMTLFEFCSWFAREKIVLNRAITVHALAQREAQGRGAPDDLGDTYNGSIDPFVDAFSLRSMLDAAEMRTPARNDALDLAHFLYLEPSMTLSTGDARMTETAKGIGLRVVSPEAVLEADGAQ